LCYKILLEDTKNLSPNTLIKDSVHRMIKLDKVLKNDSFHTLKGKFQDEIVSFMIVQE